MERRPLPPQKPFEPLTGSSQQWLQSIAVAANVAAFSGIWNATIKKAVAASAGSSTLSPVLSQLPFECYVKAVLPIRLAMLHPLTWTKEDVAVFLLWCRREFNLPPIDMERFWMNGATFCMLTRADVQSRAPCCGDVIYNVLKLLMDMEYLDFSNVQLPQAQPPPADDKQKNSAAQQSPDTASLKRSPIQSEKSVSVNNGDSDQTKIFSPKSKSDRGASKTNQDARKNNCRIRLWEFLQRMLNDPSQRYSNMIVWKNAKHKVFKIVDPHKLAKHWGIEKNHLAMNYDKLSRSLRHYYKLKIMRKFPGEALCFQFL